MLCQNCNQREANVHITKIINGDKTELHLCEECAKQKQEFNISSTFSFGMPLSFQNIIDGFYDVMGGTHYLREQEKRCPVCNITFEDFRRNGRLGCGNCYSAFRENIVPLVRRVHGNIEHSGKVPKRTGGVLKIKREIDRLKEQLRVAVTNEEYEKAARLRDEIRDLESKINNEGK
jgi:protein arginine kinase activator